MHKLNQLALIGLLSSASVLTYAYESGDMIVRGGAASVQPEDSSGGIAVPPLNIAAISGTSAEVGNDTQLGLTFTYMFSDSFGVELLAATPFSHDVTVNFEGLTPGLRVAAGKVKHLPPTLSAVYYPFGSSEGSFKPYVGIGLNYTIFFEEESNLALETFTGTLAGAAGPVPLTLNVDDSWGLALQLGADYALSDQWLLNAAVRWIDIDTEAEYTSSLGSTITVGDLEIDPYVYQLTVGYVF